MKNVFVWSIVLVGFIAAYAANANKIYKKKSGPAYRLEFTDASGTSGLSDTLAIGTGNSATIYVDSTTDRQVGIEENSDSLRVYVYFAGEADTSQAQIEMKVQPQAGTGFQFTMDAVDTLDGWSATAKMQTFKFRNYPGMKHVLKITAFGTTDEVNILGIRVLPE